MTIGPGPAESAAAAGWPRRLAAAVVHTLTFGRLFLALGFPWLPPSWWLAAIVAGGLSDLLDGLVSRLAGVESMVGQIVDPIADKLFVASVLLTVWWAELLALWQVPLVAFRDLAVAAVSVVAVGSRGWGALRRMPPSRLGKLATAAQFVFLVALLYDRGQEVRLAPAAFGAAAILSVSAGVGYLRRASAAS